MVIAIAIVMVIVGVAGDNDSDGAVTASAIENNSGFVVVSTGEVDFVG